MYIKIHRYTDVQENVVLSNYKADLIYMLNSYNKLILVECFHWLFSIPHSYISLIAPIDENWLLSTFTVIRNTKVIQQQWNS